MDWFGKPASKTKRGQPRRRVKPLYRRPLFVAGFLLCLVGSASVAGWWVWQIGWVQQTSERAKWFVIAAASKTGFSVREIFVDGRFETSRKTLLKALRLERGAPILVVQPITERLFNAIIQG